MPATAFYVPPDRYAPSVVCASMEAAEEMAAKHGGRAQAAATKRWTPMRFHEGQAAIWKSDARFIAAFCGRRSGKTELLGLRKPLMRILKDRIPDGRYVFAEPIYRQAKNNLWRPLLQLLPKTLIADISKSDLVITLRTGARLECVGMDSPERVEGAPIDGIVMDEFANMKPEAWTEHVLPGLDTPGRKPGWAFFPGTPEGRNHAYELHLTALENATGEWESYHWPSSDIQHPDKIEALRANLDELTFEQEINGSFVSPTGRAYSRFEKARHVQRVDYNPNLPLILCFDFNVDPGVAAVAQDQVHEGRVISCVIDEIYIPRSSTTDDVCGEIVRRWGDRHSGQVICYGDPAGRNRSTRGRSTDWDIIEQHIRRQWSSVRIDVGMREADPGIANRVNSVNARLCSAAGVVSMWVDPKCRELIRDFEQVGWKKGATGQLDKSDLARTHLSDAVAYWMAKAYGVRERISRAFDPDDRAA